MTTEVEQIDNIDVMLVYLDNLRESGATNMFGARPYLREMFPELSLQEASNVLSYWMQTFTERHGIN